MRWIQALFVLLFYVWLAIGVFMGAFVLTHGGAEGRNRGVSRQTGPEGVALIKAHEGCVLRTYRCPANKCTIGYGHTGADVRPNMTITQEHAEKLLRQDLEVVEEAIARLVTVPLSQAQHDAVVSLVFNIGVPAFARSTMLRLINAKEHDKAAEQFSRWVHVSGTLLPGLVKRRKAEAELFLRRA